MSLGRLPWLLLVVPALAHAGTLYTFQTVDLQSGAPLSKTEIRMQDSHLRVDHIDESAEHDVVLFDGERLLHIDWPHRDYWLLEKDTLERFSAPGATQDFREYIIAQAPPEQRTVVAAHVNGSNTFSAMIPSTPVKLQATPRSGKVGSYGCQIYEARTESGELVHEYCVTAYEQVEGSSELMAKNRALDQLLIRTLELLGLPLELDIAQHAFGHFTLDRFAVMERDLEGTEHSEQRLIGVKQLEFEPSVFTLPPGLRRVAPFAFYTDDGSPTGTADNEEDRAQD